MRHLEIGALTRYLMISMNYPDFFRCDMVSFFRALSISEEMAC